MKTLIVYYSRYGNTKKIAHAISKNFHSNIEEIQDMKDRSKLVNWFMSASNEELKTPTKIKTPEKNPSDYNLVIIGTPIWDGITPAIKEYLKMYKSKFKKVAFFSTFGASADDAFYKMEKIINKKPIATLGVQDRQITKKEYKNRVKEFCAEIKKNL